MKKNSFMSGAFVLSVGGVLAKIFSAIYRIAITRLIGGTGIGIYQLIFPLYSLCVVLTTAGLPMAVSKVVARNKDNAKAVAKKCLIFICLFAFILSFILIVSSKALSELQGKSDIAICYIILSPTIIIVSASSVLRGYFQGKQNFTPSAVSNIVEQFVKLVVGVVLGVALINISLMTSIIGLMIGIVVSEIISVLILIIYYKCNREKYMGIVNLPVKELLKDILPITLTNVILPLAMFVDSLVVVNLLSANFSKDLSIYLYGLESGAVATIVNLPTIFSFAIASVILPNLSGNVNVLNKNNNLSLAVKIILIICVPCVLCFVLIPNRLLTILYGGKLNDFSLNGTVVAGRLLALSGLGLIFLALNQVYSSALQAVDERMVTVRNMLIAIIIKFAIELSFIPSPNLNIYALAIANTFCYLTVMMLNQVDVNLKFKLKINYNFTAKLLLSNLFMLLSLLAILNISNSSWNTLFAVVFAGVIYIICLWFTNIFSKRDKAMIKYKV